MATPADDRLGGLPKQRRPGLALKQRGELGGRYHPAIPAVDQRPEPVAIVPELDELAAQITIIRGIELDHRHQRCAAGLDGQHVHE